jgi:hypothetical protein
MILTTLENVAVAVAAIVFVVVVEENGRPCHIL